MTRLRPLLSHQVFRWASGISAALALALGVVASLMGGTPGLRAAHGVLAMVFLGTSLVAGLSGMRYGKESRTKGLAWLGLGVFAAAVVQYALGELGYAIPHLVVGIALVLAAGALFVRSLQQPVAVTAADPGA